ncbi:hypothetical protein BV25DRAFT_1827037 [Artomyces pyxidatus]|uniref:Uncharacterized protein n=1 Tax=Artomyces pyxidatus TaxID=48021 RepID=A0ACB8SX44_9AGAM|nr:hypothetical protein BV25DRAFT_1827037 [Artomyces pyxidatus]
MAASYAAAVVSQQVQVATLALFTYDWLILLGDEVTLVWPSRWTIPKVLFLLSRYLPFIDLSVNLIHCLGITKLSPAACSFTFDFISWSMTLGMALSEVVMILRVHAIYERSKRVLYSLGSLWVILTGTAFFFIYLSTRSQKFLPSSGSTLYGCRPEPSRFSNMTLMVSFASLLLMETVIVVLTLGNAYARWNSRYHSESLGLTFKTLYLDGILFFILLLSFGYLNIFFPLIHINQALEHVFIAPMRAFHGLFSCRMLINIRRIGAKRGMLPKSLRSIDNRLSAVSAVGLPSAHSVVEVENAYRDSQEPLTGGTYRESQQPLTQTGSPYRDSQVPLTGGLYRNSEQRSSLYQHRDSEQFSVGTPTLGQYRMEVR